MSSAEHPDEICVLCCREINIFATGQCDHPVCYECSTRMRVLCEQNECPICRGDMAYVIFTHKKQVFLTSRKFHLLDKRYKIAFEDQEVQGAFKLLLKHSCRTCDECFNTFSELKTHVQRQHVMFYCELCIENLKIFTFERRFYTRKDLAHHKRRGDTDDTSHKGHPMCEFCLNRFVDHDELFRHLRREHFFCHFCDVDGKHEYYSCDSHLKAHFRREHYLCEEGECTEERIFSAFRTEIDLKAHKAMKHSKNKTKAEVKQARTLDFEFTLAPRSNHAEFSPVHGEYRRGRYGNQINHQRKRNMDDYSARETVENSQDSKQEEKKTFNTQCSQDFPSLSNDSEGANSSTWFTESNRYSSCISDTSQHRVPGKAKAKQLEEFPELSSVTSKATQRALKSKIKTRTKDEGEKSQSPVENDDTHDSWGEIRKLGWLGSRKTTKEQENSEAQWGPKKAVHLDDFPRLETKENFRSSVTTADLAPQPTSCWPVRISSQDEQPLAQQIYKKCKSKKNKKKSPVAEPVHVMPTKQDTVKAATTFSKSYRGLGYNSLENEENHDPLTAARNRLITEENRKPDDNSDDDVPWRETPKLVLDDFPPLEAPVSSMKQPPGYNTSSTSNRIAPPPGYRNKSKSSQKTSHNSISLMSVAQQLNDTTMAIPKGNKTFTYSYQQPSDFQKRNNLLVKSIYESVNSDNKLFDEFKFLSGSFRENKVPASIYHTECFALFGKEKFQQLFIELLCLLPDIDKQQELLDVHNRYLKENSRNSGAVPKQKPSNDVYSVASLSVCPTCKQVLTKSDFPNHQKSHKSELI